MEYAEGGELFDYIIKEDHLSEDETRNIFHQIIDAIDYMHKMGICHRDLKPENILFDSSHTKIKIIDFGLSNLYYTNISNIKINKNINVEECGDLLETPCGSPGYAPPEMVMGNSYNGLLTDIWSSGIILYVMLCGSFPFDDDSEQILYSKIVKGKFKFPKEITLSNEVKNLFYFLTNYFLFYLMEDHYLQIRSATGKLYYAGEVFLIDPLLAKKGVYPRIPNDQAF